MANVLFVNKPVGITSFDVCYHLRKVLNTRKIGHTGTLDPNASGVMIVLYDKATKANQFLLSAYKEYECRVLLGIMTDTLDIDGNIIKEEPYMLPDKDQLIQVLDSFLGISRQEVPITSAVSVNGKRLYQYQREGKEVELPIRDIEVTEIKLLDMHEDGFSFSCRVSSGTYIRALARDILKKLNLTGTLSQLKRTAIDKITIDMCDELADIEKGIYRTHDLKDLFRQYFVLIEYPDEKAILNGKKIHLDCKEERVAIICHDELLAIYEKDQDLYRCVRGLW